MGLLPIVTVTHRKSCANNKIREGPTSFVDLQAASKRILWRRSLSAVWLSLMQWRTSNVAIFLVELTGLATYKSSRTPRLVGSQFEYYRFICTICTIFIIHFHLCVTGGFSSFIILDNHPVVQGNLGVLKGQRLDELVLIYVDLCQSDACLEKSPVFPMIIYYYCIFLLKVLCKKLIKMAELVQYWGPSTH